MRYLVLGPGKSGTTAVARAIELGTGKQVEVFFEPRSLESVTSRASSSTVLAKMLIEDWSLDDRPHIDWFDRCVFVARDPRDVLISRLLYQVFTMEFIHDPEKLEQFLTALRDKEQSPGEHSVQSLLELVARLEGSDSELEVISRILRKAAAVWRAAQDSMHLLRYEDFVDGRTADLSAYLDLPIDEHVDVAKKWQRVARTKSHGDWKNWFTDADDEVARRAFRDYLDTFGYDDWGKPTAQQIDPDHSSEYVKRIVRDAQGRRAQTNPGGRLRPSLSRGIQGREEVPLPPKRLRFMGESDQGFIALGDRFVETLTEHAGLRDDSRVLDIGCGYGRLPHALKRTGFAGSYLGIDVLKKHVRWCNKRLGEPRFRFRHADIKNERYNPKGSLAVGDLDLGDERFDVVAAFSVFTHMWPEDVEAYLRLASGVLAPDGRLAATFFVLDHVWHQLADEDRVALRMPFEREPGCRYESDDDPLHRVGYEGRWVVLNAADAGLVPAGHPVYGTWSQRPIDPDGHPGYQDLFVFRPGELAELG